MRDKRPVDELSIAELERILAVRRREERLARARRYTDRQIPVTPSVPPEAVHAVPLSLSEVVSSTDLLATSAENVDGSYETQETSVIAPRFEDDFEAPSRPRNPRPARKIWLNRLLTGVEVVAAGGLIYLLASVFVSLQAITQTSADIQAAYQATYQSQVIQPTATPVIDVAALVLPGGHVYDGSNSGHFKLEEIPVQYRAAYQQQVLSIAPVAPPTASPQQALTIVIPALHINAPVVEGDNWDDLQRGVGHHPGSANPDELGNMVLAGHDDIYGSIFKDLPSLKPGDQIIVTTQTDHYTYTVQSHEIVAPTETRVMDNSHRDVRQLTLITCYPYQVDSQRWVVYATLNS